MDKNQIEYLISKHHDKTVRLSIRGRRIHTGKLSYNSSAYRATVLVLDKMIEQYSIQFHLDGVRMMTVANNEYTYIKI